MTNIAPDNNNMKQGTMQSGKIGKGCKKAKKKKRQGRKLSAKTEQFLTAASIYR